MKKAKSRQPQTAKPGRQPRLRRLTPRRIIRLLALSSYVAGGVGLTGLRFYIPNEEGFRTLGEDPSMFLQDFERLNEIYQAILMGGVRITL